MAHSWQPSGPGCPATPHPDEAGGQLAREVLKSNDKLCSSRALLRTVAILSLDGKNIAFSPDNDHCRKLRRLATLHLLSAKKLQESLPVREGEIRDMLDAIAADATATAAPAGGGMSIEVRRYLNRATLNNIMRLTVGKRFCYSSIRGAAEFTSKAILDAAMSIDWNKRIAAMNGEQRGGIRGSADAVAAPTGPAAAAAAEAENSELLPSLTEEAEGEVLFAIIEEAFALAGAFNIADYVPWLSYCGDPFRMYARAQRLAPQLRGFMRACIEERRQLMLEKRTEGSQARQGRLEMEKGAALAMDGAAGEQVKARTASKTTLVDTLLEMEGDGEEQVNEDDMLMLALDLMLAGTDTTAKTVEWALAELAQHPNMLERLRDEVDVAYAKSASVAAETGAPEMPYLQAVLKESFRHHPVAPLFFPRLTSGRVTLGGYSIPPNTMININNWALGHDPTVWINPHKFDPSRFLKPDAPDVTGQNFSLLPFGSGRRGCLGTSLGLDLSARLLANFVWRFDFEAPQEVRAGGGLDMRESLGMSMVLATPLRIVVRERRKCGGGGLEGRRWAGVLPALLAAGGATSTAGSCWWCYWHCWRLVVLLALLAAGGVGGWVAGAAAVCGMMSLGGGGATGTADGW
ncbi:unnamed protein product [Closterium sp. NIES-54]